MVLNTLVFQNVTQINQQLIVIIIMYTILKKRVFDKIFRWRAFSQVVNDKRRQINYNIYTQKLNTY